MRATKFLRPACGAPERLVSSSPPRGCEASLTPGVTRGRTPVQSTSRRTSEATRLPVALASGSGTVNPLPPSEVASVQGFCGLRVPSAYGIRGSASGPASCARGQVARSGPSIASGTRSPSARSRTAVRSRGSAVISVIRRLRSRPRFTAIGSGQHAGARRARWRGSSLSEDGSSGTSLLRSADNKGPVSRPLSLLRSNYSWQAYLIGE